MFDEILVHCFDIQSNYTMSKCNYKYDLEFIKQNKNALEVRENDIKTIVKKIEFFDNYGFIYPNAYTNN